MKKIKLEEDSYKRLKSALINEISVGLVDNANRVSDKIFWRVKSKFDSFYDELEETISNLMWEMDDNQMKSNPYISKIKEYADAIKVILDKKAAQGERFYDETDKIDNRKFYDSLTDDSDEYLEDMELRDAQKKFPKG